MTSRTKSPVNKNKEKYLGMDLREKHELTFKPQITKYAQELSSSKNYW